MLDWTALNKAKLQPIRVIHRPDNRRPVAQGGAAEVTGSTVKISAVLQFDNLKTSRNAVRSHNPRLAIGRRKFGIAGLTAPRAPQIFNPMVLCGHPPSMTQISKRSYVV
jgi:hypothetical protein